MTDHSTNAPPIAWQDRKLQLVAQPFAIAVSQSAIPTLMADPTRDDLPIVFANDSFLALSGWTEEEVLGRNLHFLNVDPSVAKRLAASVTAGETVSEDVWLSRKGGETFWARLDVAPLFDAGGQASLLFITLVDVSDRVTAVKGLAESRARFDMQLSERTTALMVELERTELLSRELTHRTKNALAILAAVIAAKSRRAATRAEADLLADIAGRVRAIGGLQGLLEGVKSEQNGIALPDLLARLAADLDRPTDTRVVLREIPRAMLSADAALCVALCVTELVLNAQKHGLRYGQEGVVAIAAGMEDGRVTLVIEDSGDGLPDGFDPSASTGLGMLVVLDQVARLGGTFTCGRSADGGARFEIAFRP